MAMDLRAHLERMRDVQTAQLQALTADDDLRLDALLDEMAALTLGLPDDALQGCDDPAIQDLALSVRAAQDELIARAEERRAHARGALTLPHRAREPARAPFNGARKRATQAS